MSVCAIAGCQRETGRKYKKNRTDLLEIMLIWILNHIEFAMPVAIPRKQIKMDLKLRKRSGLEKEIWES